jgi:hypothetical protein
MENDLGSLSKIEMPVWHRSHIDAVADARCSFFGAQFNVPRSRDIQWADAYHMVRSDSVSNLFPQMDL